MSPQPRWDQAGGLSQRWGAGVTRSPAGVSPRRSDVHPGPAARHGAAVEGGLVPVRGKDAEGPGGAVGGGSPADVAGRQGGRGDRWVASDADETEAPGLTPQ